MRNHLPVTSILSAVLIGRFVITAAVADAGQVCVAGEVLWIGHKVVEHFLDACLATSFCSVKSGEGMIPTLSGDRISGELNCGPVA